MSNVLNLTPAQLDAYIYRIISLPHLYALFERNENVLVHPSRWEDPYENFILRSKVRDKAGHVRAFTYHEYLYGQCWTLNASSDAMWRIYSREKQGIRIRTTVRKLLQSLYDGGVFKPRMLCVIGKVRYLTREAFKDFANSIYRDGKLKKDMLFETLLVKRPAFRHEREVRLLCFDEAKLAAGGLLRYKLDPHLVFDQLMIDPRVSYADFETLKAQIERRTGFRGEILRSLLYKPPEELILEDAGP